MSELRALCKDLSPNYNSSELCLSTRSLRLVYLLYISELRSLYKFLSLIDNAPEDLSEFEASVLLILFFLCYLGICYSLVSCSKTSR